MKVIDRLETIGLSETDRGLTWEGRVSQSHTECIRCRKHIHTQGATP